MSDKNINNMDFKELRNEVQMLRDELAIMQRKYEDILYNLDTENFSSKFVKGINSKVSSDEVESMISQTESEIKSQIRGVDGRVSLVYQEVGKIESSVKDIVGGEESIFTQTAQGFILDGNKVIITGIFYLTDDSKENAFSIHHDESQGFAQVMMSTISPNANGKYDPIVIGDVDQLGEINVYVGSFGNGHQVATRNWVNENNIAKFG